MALTNFHEDITDDVQKHAPYGYTDKTNWSSALMNYVELTLTSGEVNALDTSAFELVEAQGANKVIIPEFVTSVRKAGTAYTTGSNFKLYYDSGTTDSQWVAISSSALTGTVEYIYFNSHFGSGNASSVMANKNISLSGGAISGGTGEVVVRLWYRVIDIS